MSEYNIQMNKYNVLSNEYDKLYPQPMKHASTHAKDGSDPILPSSIGAYSKSETDTLLANKPSKSPVHVDDANDVTKSGFYTCKTNIPFGYGLANVLAVGDIDDPNNIFTQIAFGVNLNPTNRNAIAVRCYVPGEGFKDWEWVNPPMSFGVEYRTTERFNGKPVYVKRFDAGQIPNASTKFVELGLSRAETRVFDVKGILFSKRDGSDEFIEFGSIPTERGVWGTVGIFMSADDNYWFSGLSASADAFSGDNFKVELIVKYYKTTD